MSPPQPPVRNGWGDLAGTLGFFSVLFFVFAIWTSGSTQMHWFWTGLFFTVLASAASIPGIKAHIRR